VLTSVSGNFSGTENMDLVKFQLDWNDGSEIFAVFRSTGPDILNDDDCAVLIMVSWCQQIIDIGSPEDYFFDYGAPGTWSAVPLPAAAYLFISALGGLVLAKRRRQKT